MNIKEILELLPEEERAKADKFIINLDLAIKNPINTKNVVDILASYGMTFKKFLDTRVFLIEASELIDKIEQYKGNGMIPLVKNDLAMLRYKVDVIIGRVLACKQVNKPYCDETEKLYPFITNDDEWARVEMGLGVEDFGLATMEDVFASEKIAKIYDCLSIENVSLDFDEYDRCSRVMAALNAMLSNVNQNENFNVPFDNRIEKNEALVKRLVSDKELKDEEIVIAALIYGNFIKKDKIDEYKSKASEALNGVVLSSFEEPFANLESSGMSR